MLPKIQHPIFEFNIPSLNKKFHFRPFLTKEEKILLIAKSSEDKTEILRAIKQIINNCSLDNLDIDKLAMFDIEYLFLQLRSVSVNNIVKVSYRDNEDNEIYDFDVDLSKIEVIIPKVEKKIMVDKNVGILMRYAPASIVDEMDFTKIENDLLFDIILKCIDSIFDKEEVYDPATYTKEELESFLDNCGIKVLEKIQEFLQNAPRMKYEIDYTNKNGNSRKIVLDSLTDFFTLG